MEEGSGETLWDEGVCLEDGGDGGSTGYRGEGRLGGKDDPTLMTKIRSEWSQA